LDAGDVFSREAVEGVFVLRDEATGCVQTTDAAMADQGFSPKSTFKIPNALIGLESGVIEGERHLWRWDGVPCRLRDWEQDLDLAGALKVSCVPCFQDVARRVGAQRMRGFLGDFGYGNQNISGPIDEFWLDGQLRITPRGQVEFLHRMLSGELPLKRSNVELVWRLLEIESGPGFTFRGKTGLGSQDGRAVGWLVGYVERAGHRWAYATLVRGRGGADMDAEMTRLMPVRRSITRALLVRAHVLSGP
jgi:beta-lactamase class D